MESTLRRTWAEVNLDTLAYNYETLCKHVGGTSKFVGVVKADAYGHGSVQVCKVLEELGAGYLAVSNMDEGVELRKGGIKMPVLQLGTAPYDQVSVMIANDITQTIYSEDAAKAFSEGAVAAGGKVKGHIKLDTGMSRLGFQCDADHFEASVEAICRVAQLPGLELEGIFTHFCVSDEEIVPSKEYTELQHKRFVDMIAALEAKGVKFELHHCCNSGATVAHPEYAYDMFRPGIITYGISSLAGQLNLKPVLTLKTVVGTIKEYTPETTIGYGRTYTTEKPMRVGVLPVGYADGFHRALSNKWKLWTPYGLAPIVGRICMDQCMVDLTDLPQVQVGDELEIWGENLSIDDASAMAGTICNETICGISKRVPRVYIKDGKEIYRELLLRG